MITTEVPPSAAVDAPVSRTAATVSGTRELISRTPEFVSGAPSGVSDDSDGRPGSGPLTGSQKLTAGVIVLAALALASIGLYLSFEHVAGFAHDRLGFSSLGKARMFTVGVDTGIMVLIAIDLLMAWLKRPISWIRYPVWLLTAATVVLNAASAAPQGRPWETLDYIAAFAHAIVPMLFIVVVEVGRTAIDRIVRPGHRQERSSIPLNRWVLAPVATPRLYRRMRLWGITSYPEMVRREQELIAYELWLKRKYKGDLRKASEDELLPMTMAPFGYTVAQALAMPDEQERAAEAREEEAGRRRLEAETRREVAKAKAEAERLRAEGQVEAVRAEVAGETGQARAHARAQVSAAERAAELEEAALETAVIAEARSREAEAQRKEAEARQAAAEADWRAAETERGAAEARRAAAETDRKAAEEQHRREAAVAETLRARQAAAEAERVAAETRLAAAGIERRAVELEDAAKLTPRQRAVRKVARLILSQAGGDAERLPLAEIQREMAVSSPGTASEYRQEATELLASGYRP